MHSILKCIIKGEVKIFFLFRKKKETKRIPVEITKKKLKGPSFLCQKYVDQKYLWRYRTL